MRFFALMITGFLAAAAGEFLYFRFLRRFITRTT